LLLGLPHNGHDKISYISKPREISKNIIAVTMDAADLKRIIGNIEFMKRHFKSVLCDCETLSTEGPRVLQELEETLLSQDAYIKGIEEPGQHDDVLYQAKRLVAMLENKSV